MTKTAKPEWPAELEEPIDATVTVIPFSLDPIAAHEAAVDDALRKEIQQRTAVIANFLECRAPTRWDPEWANLLAQVCEHWDIPGFELPELQSNKIWTERKLCELVADVRSLVNETITENAACKHIAGNSERFGSRYPMPPKSNKDAWGLTLHRRFEEAKAEITANEYFRLLHFGDHVLGILNRQAPEWGPDLWRVAIERYAIGRPTVLA